MSTASFVAISNVAHKLTLWQVDPLIRELLHRYGLINLRTQEPEEVGQLQLAGIAAVLETRLHQAQTEAMPAIDFLCCLVSDERPRRSERLLERRKKRPRSETLRRLSSTSTSTSTERRTVVWSSI